MAGANQNSVSASIATTSYETALCIIPPQHQCQHIDNLRSLYDKGYSKWPPHINLLYPFVAPEQLPGAKEKIESALASLPYQQSLDVTLDTAGCFKHKASYTIWIGESDDSGSLENLRLSTLKALGHRSTRCNFHLTIGQSEDASESAREFLLSKARLIPGLKFPTERLAILVRERIPGADSSANRMRLWGTVNIPKQSATVISPLSEFWIEQGGKTVDSDSDSEADEANGPTTVPVFSRQIQPGTTYTFNPATQSWKQWVHSGSAAPVPASLTVSSYNVLIDSEYPPARDRDPHVRDAILSQAALADILVLQEVSDDFLSYLLTDPELQECYPFTSHGPPEQVDIGPLPSLRNVVVLSKWSFSWEFVPFHRRHKGAVVATFGSVVGSTPLVVAGVHLTCGLTDGSVAAKKVQAQNLKNHLSRHYPSDPWIVAGDFNIATSSYTIETALKNKSISHQTVKTLASIETLMSEAGLLDTWCIARVEAADRSANFDGDDLFDGEEGATFNPRENELAAATSGTSNNRPQRYDRILIRPKGALRVIKFNQFGRPTTVNGVDQVPSDHWGIRATMAVVTESSGKLASGADALEQHMLNPKQASASLSNTDLLTSTLVAHDMFPSDNEIQSRRAAFDLIEDVLLGPTDGQASSASDVPLIITTVGSYALGVWTSASDIDCLCVGSISSKTFFKLARQRLLRAESRGIRLLRKVEAHSGTMFELSVNGVSVDLQYCPAARVAERWKELPTLHQSDPIFNLPVLSLHKLKPYRDIAYIQRTLPSLSVFRLAYRCIKLWAVQRGIYSSRFGYLSGIHITLMLTIVYKRLVYDVGSLTAADLVTNFFHHFAQFDWQKLMLFDPFFHKTMPRYHRSAREPMAILGYHAPNANVAHTSTVPGLNTLVKELKLADQFLSREAATWEQFFGSPRSSIVNESSNGKADFLYSHDSYVKIDIQYWGRTLGKGKGLVGWVESRCLLLVVDINKALPHLDVRIWPARFAKSDSEATESDYHGCYLIGLSRGANDSKQTSKDDKVAARVSLDKCFERFQNQLQADNKCYDPNDCWIGISLAKSSEVKNLTLDAREWGEYMADFDLDSDDEDEDAEEFDDTEELPATRKLAVRRAPSSSTSIPVSGAKLRPASDVLNRLRWDPTLDPSDYIVGYEDRFLGAKETSLERWKTEQTDDEFIPQHRILYFKRRGDGVVIWERKSRTDLVFGSGASSAKEVKQAL
ncbi:hypothetical protein BDV96DRAFT_562792 [Lophiotrema nucula]|uniref:polynucleotide adenylyltransferase n=1 Tax=Lophiotrema nucula TaxID=690887 RepID=A0A6A5ZUW7_9PLEO|nr:hypothetical protein BDV96DRAFT_562792 [Lophiotrema nucula]